MNENTQLGLELLTFIIIIFMISNLAFDMGENKGRKDLCKIGMLVKNIYTEEVMCLVSTNEEPKFNLSEQRGYNG